MLNDPTLSDVPRVVNFTETACRTVAARARRRGEHGVRVSGGRVSVGKDRKVRVMDGDGCTTMWMYFVLQNCISKNG